MAAGQKAANTRTAIRVRIEYFLPRRREELERDAADQGIELVARFRELLGHPVDLLIQRIEPALRIFELSRISLPQLLFFRAAA